MSNYEQQIIQGIKDLGNNGEESFIAVVENNYPKSDRIDVRSLSGTLYPDVRKRAALKKDKEGIIITPVKGSTIIVSRIAKSDELFVSMFSSVESIVIDGGENLGIIKIEELTAKLNALVKSVNRLIEQFNSHTHVVATTGTASAQAGTAAKVVTSVSKAQDFKRSDYENDKIKH